LPVIKTLLSIECKFFVIKWVQILNVTKICLKLCVILCKTYGRWSGWRILDFRFLLRTRASAEKNSGEGGQRKKQGRKIASLAFLYFISSMHKNQGEPWPPCPPLPTPMINESLQLRLQWFFFVWSNVVLCSVSVIPLQHRSCSVCMSFVRLGYSNYLLKSC